MRGTNWPNETQSNASNMDKDAITKVISRQNPSGKI